MTFVVPFDGSRLSAAALVRARQYATALEGTPPEATPNRFEGEPIDLVAVCVVPEGARYARQKGWIGADDEFDAGSVVESLREEVSDIAPGARFRHARADRSASAGTIATTLRRVARDEGASVVFVGSENAGRIVTPVTSVGEGVASGDRYDVHIVRHGLPPEAERDAK